MSQKLQLYRNNNILSSREAAVNAVTAELSTRHYDGEFIAMRYYHNVTVLVPTESGETEVTEKIIKTIFGCGAYDITTNKYNVTIIDLEAIENRMSEMGSTFEDALQELHNTINSEIKVALDKEIADRIQGENDIKKIITDNERVVAESLSEISDSVGLDENFKYVQYENDIYLSAATSHSNADKVLSQEIARLSSEARVYTITEVEPSEDNVRVAYQLVDQDNNVSGATIKIYKDSALQEVVLVEEDDKGVKGQFLKFTYITATGDPNIIYLDVSTFLVEAEFKDGFQVKGNGEVSIKLADGNETFLTVSDSGVKLSGVQNAIDNAVADLRVTVQDDITPRLEQLAQTIKDSTISAITVNDVTGTVNTENTAVVTIDGSDVKLSSDYTPVTYPKSGTSSAFTAVAASATLDSAVKLLDENLAMLVEEVILNEKTIAESLSVLRKSAGFDVNGEYIASQIGGYLANTTSITQALANFSTKLEELEARIAALESQL